MIEVQITGMEELIRKVQDPELLGEPLRNFLNFSLAETAREVAIRTKRDTSRLAASINNPLESVTIDASPIPLWGMLKPPEEYAKYVEWDTRPHFPPIKAIAEWAHRHNMVPFLVARAIARHGTKGAHMFRDGLTAALPTMQRFLSNCAREIETRWGNK